MSTDPLTIALAEAVGGRRQRLFDLLARGSRLPGPRINEDLAEAFAVACRSAGVRADAVALAMARLSADEAPGATPLEFLPVCGLRALGARAAADAGVRGAMMAELHAHADDLRFRVRDAVVEGLARVGAASGERTVDDVASWMDGYFHAAAVLRALSADGWLSAVHDADPVTARLEEAFVLVRDAPRAAARWPGHKALLDALGEAPVAFAARLGVPVFDLLARWAAVRDPAIQAALAKVLGAKRLAGRFGVEVERVRAAEHAARPAPRNPDHDVGPTRDRSKSRRKGRR
jgi:hypothetical protein